MTSLLSWPKYAQQPRLRHDGILLSTLPCELFRRKYNDNQYNTMDYEEGCPQKRLVVYIVDGNGYDTWETPRARSISSSTVSVNPLFDRLCGLR